MNERTRGMIEMVAAMMICGTIGWLVVVSGRPVTQVVLWRCVFGVLVLLPICATKGYLRSGRMSWRQFAIAVAGGAALVANWLLLFSAYSKSSISIATTVYNTQPFMLVGLGALFLGERLTLAKLGWLSLSFCGMLLIVQTQSESGAAQSNYLLGIALSLGAAFFYALVALFAKQLKGVPPHLIALVHVIVGIVVLSPLVLQGGGPLERLPGVRWPRLG